MLYRSCIACIVLLFSASLCYAQKPPADSAVKLAWKLNEGQTLRVKLEQEMTQTRELEDKPSVAKQETELDMLWQVVSVEGELASLTNTLMRATMSMELPQVGRVAFDSNDASDVEGIASEFGKILRPLINEKCRQKLSTKGLLSEIEIPDEVLAKMRSSTMLPRGTENMIGDIIARLSVSLPEQAVKPGDTWTQELTTANPAGNVVLVNTYTYRGPHSNEDGSTYERIDVETKTTFDVAGATIKINEQKTDGTIFFDNVAGRIASSSIKQSLTMEFQSGPNQFQQVVEQTTKATFSSP